MGNIPYVSVFGEFCGLIRWLEELKSQLLLLPPFLPPPPPFPVPSSLSRETCVQPVRIQPLFGLVLCAVRFSCEQCVGITDKIGVLFMSVPRCRGNNPYLTKVTQQLNTGGFGEVCEKHTLNAKLKFLMIFYPSDATILSIRRNHSRQL